MGPNIGPNWASQTWDPNSDPNWDPNLGLKLGLSNFGSNCGLQVEPRFGFLLWVAPGAQSGLQTGGRRLTFWGVWEAEPSGCSGFVRRSPLGVPGGLGARRPPRPAVTYRPAVTPWEGCGSSRLFPQPFFICVYPMFSNT